MPMLHAGVEGQTGAEFDVLSSHVGADRLDTLWLGDSSPPSRSSVRVRDS